MIGDVRSVTADRAVYVALVFILRTGVRKAHEGRCRVRLDAAGRAEPRGEIIVDVGVVRGHVVGQHDGGFVDNGLGDTII